MRMRIRSVLVIALTALLLGAMFSGIAFAAEGEAATPGLYDNRGVVNALVWDDTGNENGIYDESLGFVDGLKADLYYKDLNNNWVLLKSTVSGAGWYMWDSGFLVEPPSPLAYPRGWFGFNELPLKQGTRGYVDYKIAVTPPDNYFMTGAADLKEGPAVRTFQLSPPVWYAWFAHYEYFYPNSSSPKTRGFSVGRYSSVSGRVYNDLWPDGKHQCLEPGMWNVTVKLQGTNKLGQAVSLQAVTSCSGSYSFGKLRMGNYKVTEVVPRYWKNTSPAGISMALGSGQDAAVDFNNRLMTPLEMLFAR